MPFIPSHHWTRLPSISLTCASLPEIAGRSTLHAYSLATRRSHPFRGPSLTCHVGLLKLFAPLLGLFSTDQRVFPLRYFWPKSNKQGSLLAPTSISVLHERHDPRVLYHRDQLDESYILRTFPPLHSLHIHGNLDIIVESLTYLHTYSPDFMSLESLELALESTSPGELYDPPTV